MIAEAKKRHTSITAKVCLMLAGRGAVKVEMMMMAEIGETDKMVEISAAQGTFAAVVTVILQAMGAVVAADAEKQVEMDNIPNENPAIPSVPNR
jgi:hypothetical protein